MYVCVYEREREGVCVCVCVRERERQTDRQTDRVCSFKEEMMLGFRIQLVSEHAAIKES